MPSTSKKQHDAMEAAAHGDSTLGIPASVGAKFVAADAGRPEPKKPKTAKPKSTKPKLSRYLDGEKDE